MMIERNINPEKPNENEGTKKIEKTRGPCAASKKDRRKCSVEKPNYQECHTCPLCGFEEGDINLGRADLRGGIEDSRASAAWRKNKLIHGIPHGDD